MGQGWGLLLGGGPGENAGPNPSRTLSPPAPRPYSDLQDCLEREAEHFDLGFPNPWAEQVIFKTHQTHFANCTEQTTFSDPPEDVLLAMIIAPICLIPFLVTLVVWKSKDSEART